jgi:transglutaminase-like putative cysteine protease
LQAIIVIDAPGGVLYAVGEPMAPDVPYQARLYGPGDLISLGARERMQRYSVLSMVPAVSKEQLRAAGRDDPDPIRARYLSLPEIPQRVLDKAAEVVAGIDNPYDQAVAIETYLRNFEYTLEIDEPPPDRDVVDYFLFDLRKGYCDYYASAMVVMARAVGIPARLAVGYASGYYDERTDEYTVTEAEAHSWPELYFPPYGWIPFEPTASRSPFERIGLPEAGETQPGADVSQGLQELRQWNPWPRQWLARFGALGLALAVAGIGYLAWLRYQLRTLGPVAMAYASLVWWGRRLGEAHSLAETPHEHAHFVAWQMERIAQAARRGRRWLQRWRNAALADLAAIAEAYTEEVYAASPPADAKRRQVGIAWRRLRGKLWAFWIARRL